MNKTQNKIKNLSRKISSAFAIGIAIYSIIVVFAIGGLIAASVKSDGALASFLQGFTVGDINAKTKVEYLFPLIFAILLGTVTTILKFFFLHRIFSVISREASPFNKVHTKSLKIIAAIQIVSSVFNVTAYTLETVAKHNGWSFQIDVSGIVFGVLLYLVALIYDYGCDLQQQSDETL